MNTEELWDDIPSNELGNTPEWLADKNPKLYRAIIAKRGVESAYEEIEDPESGIRDLLIDLRHLCDLCGLNFGKVDHESYRKYTEEHHALATANE